MWILIFVLTVFSPISTYASVGDNVGNSKLEKLVGDPVDRSGNTLFGLLYQLFDVIGIANPDEIPTDVEYSQATLIGKVNYIEQELRSVFQSASDGKLLLQSSLATEGINISESDPQPFATINDSLNQLISNYKTRLGEMDVALQNANANQIITVQSKGWNGPYDGNSHGITVMTDNSVYDVKYGTSQECTEITSPVYTNAGNYTVYYNVVGKSNNKVLSGSENVSISKLAGSLTLSKTSASLNVGGTTTVTATNRSGGSVSASSSNTSVATVSQSGNTFTITAKGAGSCTISFYGAASTNYGGGSASMSVMVTNPAPAAPAGTVFNWGLRYNIPKSGGYRFTFTVPASKSSRATVYLVVGSRINESESPRARTYSIEPGDTYSVSYVLYTGSWVAWSGDRDVTCTMVTP